MAVKLMTIKYLQTAPSNDENKVAALPQKDFAKYKIQLNALSLKDI